MQASQTTDPHKFLMTFEEHQFYQEQLDRLREERDRHIPERLRDARSFVASDAAEEIAQIQDDLTVMDVRIAQLEALLADAEVVDDDELPADVAALGRSVTVQYVRTGRLATYELGRIAQPSRRSRVASGRSPMGRALLGRSCGDVVEVELASGRTESLRILSVSLPAPSIAVS